MTKSTSMKRLLPLFLFVAFAYVAGAQTATYSVTTTPCHNNGVLTAYFAGVTPPLIVNWRTDGTTGTVITHTDVTGLTDDLTNYSGGPVSLSVTDATGSTYSMSPFGGAPPIHLCSITVNSSACPNPDTVIASVCSGGIPPYTFQWYNVADFAVVGAGSTMYLQPGTYGVTVTDAAGCTYGAKVDASLITNVASFPTYFVSVNVTPANCTDGSATVTPYGGGTPPFTYQWSNGATSATIFGLSTGALNVTVKDATGCAFAQSVPIPAGTTPTIAVSTTSASCGSHDGTVSATVFGGTPPYYYSWSNGADTSAQISLAPGPYSITVIDANGCINIASATVGASTPVTAVYSVTPSLCTAATGSATLMPTGGTGSYSIQWITSPPQTGAVAINLTYGDYTYTVTDGSGCSYTGTAYIPPTDVISASYSDSAATCASSNGSLTVYPVGGVAPYYYLWNTGATTPGISHEPAGNYSVTITDAMGCKHTETAHLPSNSPVNVGFTTTPASCLFAGDGIDSAVVWGGTPPYSYAWSTGGSTRTISALQPGPYWLTVTDAAGCASNGNYSYVNYDPTNFDCYCTISGTVYADVNGNCVQDAGEIGIPNMQIYVSGMGYTYTNAYGNYSYRVPPGTYQVSETVSPIYHLSGCQLNNVTVIASSGLGCVNTVNFANDTIPAHDVHISTWNYSAATPGSSYTNVTIISNDGNLEEDSIVANYHSDPALPVPTFVPAGTYSGSANSFTPLGSSPMLAPGASRMFFADYDVPTNAPTGTTMVFTDTASYNNPIDDWAIDYTPWNNTHQHQHGYRRSLTCLIFKAVYPVGTGPAGVISYTDSVLEYMIHFQDIEFSWVENVVIVDTLDDNLNWTTLQPEFMSAPCQVMLTQSGSKHIAQFTFSAASLPASGNDPVLSNGMLTYTIHIKNSLPVGTQFKNRASIYFDDDQPIMTNTTLNTLGSVAPTRVNNAPAAANSAFNIYPNPASESFSAVISSPAAGTASMNISDVTGKVVIGKVLTLQSGTQSVPVDVSQLAAGVYFVSLDQNGITKTQKLVIVK